MYSGNAATRPSVLTCWKDIANYMGKGVRTVQRWEREFGLPVRRPLGSSKKAVIARPSDLDAWVALRCGARNQQFDASDSSRRRSVARLASLAAQIETARQLRDNNKILIDEVHSALDRLREHIVSLHANQRPTPLAADSQFKPAA